MAETVGGTSQTGLSDRPALAGCPLWAGIVE